MIGTNKGNSAVIPNLYDGFHVYKMDWNANRIIWSIDNRVIFRYDNNEKVGFVRFCYLKVKLFNSRILYF